MRISARYGRLALVVAALGLACSRGANVIRNASGVPFDRIEDSFFVRSSLRNELVIEGSGAVRYSLHDTLEYVSPEFGQYATVLSARELAGLKWDLHRFGFRNVEPDPCLPDSACRGVVVVQGSRRHVHDPEHPRNRDFARSIDRIAMIARQHPVRAIRLGFVSLTIDANRRAIVTLTLANPGSEPVESESPKRCITVDLIPEGRPMEPVYLATADENPGEPGVPANSILVLPPKVTRTFRLAFHAHEAKVGPAVVLLRYSSPALHLEDRGGFVGSARVTGRVTVPPVGKETGR